jgi:hypothetical protein
VNKIMNQQVSLRSLAWIALMALLFFYSSVAITKACGPAHAYCGDTNCTVQIISDCLSSQSCVLRTCEYTDCSACAGRECGRTCAKIYHNPCGGCVANPLGCSGLSECCSVG